MPDPDFLYSGSSLRGALHAVLDADEQISAGRLGNSERLQECKKLEEYAAARQEWLNACDIHLSIMDFKAMTSETASVEARKRCFLECLALSQDRKAPLRNMASVIYNAALEGDDEFFRNMGSAFRKRGRRRPHDPPIRIYLLQYWFSGLLWLMNDEAGSRALLVYLKTSPQTPRTQIPIHGYRKARKRLELKGYRAFATRPPIISYWPKQKTYHYTPDWGTKLEPKLSR